MNETLRSIYYDIKNPASFSSAERLYLEARKQIPSIKLEDVKQFLSGELAYTLHRRVVRRIKRNPIVANRHGEQCQADLIDIQRYRADNDGQGYILTVIDVFSKLAFAEPIPNKSAGCVLEAFKRIFSDYHPAKIQTDEGNEFTNARLQKFFKEQMCHWFVAKNEVIKAAIVERFQRTLMTRVHKYMTSKGSREFINKLPEFMFAYNHAYHRSIRMTPTEAVDAPTKEIFKNLYGYEDERALLKSMIGEPTLKESSTVRIAEQKDRFSKGYAQNFTDQLYKVSKAIKGQRRPMYQMQDHKGRPIKGRFYQEEIQPVTSTDLYRVVVLQERKRGRGKQYLVHYVNFPDSEDEWIPGSRLKEIS